MELETSVAWAEMNEPIVNSAYVQTFAVASIGENQSASTIANPSRLFCSMPQFFPNHLTSGCWIVKAQAVNGPLTIVGIHEETRTV